MVEENEIFLKRLLLLLVKVAGAKMNGLSRTIKVPLVDVGSFSSRMRIFM